MRLNTFIQFSKLFCFILISTMIISIITYPNPILSSENTQYSLNSNSIESEKKLILAPVADNVNYEEDVYLEVWRDGTVKKIWKFVDEGNNLLSFPTILPIPLNSTYSGVRDMRIDLLLSDIPCTDPSWGYMSDYDQFGGGSYPDFATFSSNELLVRFLVWNQTTNDTINFGLNEARESITDAISDLSGVFGIDFHLMTNRTGTFDGDYGVEQIWRGFLFDLSNAWQIFFSTIPTNEGLGPKSIQQLTQADARSIYIIAEWDENPYRGGVPGLDEEDERWEFETTISLIEKEKITLSSSTNLLYLNQLLNFESILYSHQKANDSEIFVRIPYGSKINSVEPYEPANTNDVCYVGFDLIPNHNRRITEYDIINFTLEELPMPNLVAHTSANSTVVSPGDIVKIKYEIINLGETTAYNVELWGFDNTTGSPDIGWNFINETEQNHNYTGLVGGQAYFFFDEISPGEKLIQTVVLNATSSHENRTFVSTTYVHYGALDDPTSNTGWITEDMDCWGNDLDFWYNHTNPGPVFTLKVQPLKSIVHVGETISISTNITNTGNMAAENIMWVAPPFGFNMTNTNGIIDFLGAKESIIVTVDYLIDGANQYQVRYNRDYLLTRQLGGTVDLGPWGRTDDDGGVDYDGWYITSYYANTSIDGSSVYHYNYANRGDVYGSELRIDVFPAVNLTFGPFLTVGVDYSPENPSSGEIITVTMTVTNIGDKTAENVVVTSEFSENECNFYAGTGTVFGPDPSNLLGRRINYDWGKLSPGDSFTLTYQLMAKENVTSYSFSYASVDWGAFPGLSRVFNTRTFDQSAPVIESLTLMETLQGKAEAILNWNVSDDHTGTYRVLQTKATGNVTYTEISSGTLNKSREQITYSVADLEKGQYLICLEATDNCGNTANATVLVIITVPEEKGGFLEDMGDYFGDNLFSLLGMGILGAIALAEGIFIYFMRKSSSE